MAEQSPIPTPEPRPIGCPHCGHSENGAWVLPCPNKECPRHKELGPLLSSKMESAIDQLLVEFPEVEHFIILIDFRDAYQRYSNCYIRHTNRSTPQRTVKEQILRLMRLCMNASVSIVLTGFDALSASFASRTQNQTPAPKAPTEEKE